MEIFGFYFVYSLFGSLIAGFIGGIIIGLLHPEIKTVEDAGKYALSYAPVMAILYGVILSLIIIKAKGIYNSFYAVLLTIIAVPLLFYGGAALGLIPVSFLTSFESQNISSRD